MPPRPELLLVFGLLTAAAAAASTTRDNFLNLEGELVIGAFFPIHRKGPDGERCGALQMEDGLQPLEAMLFTVQQVNDDPDLLPGVRLGVAAFDSCDNPAYAMEQALHFVKGFIAHNNAHHSEEPEYRCSDGKAPEYYDSNLERIVAVIGGQSSSVSIQVATLLKLFGVPQISYLSTSPALSNKEKFPYFFRTVPSDVNQAHAMLEILRHFKWQRAAVIYSNTEYGKHGYEMLMSLAANYSVCFSVERRIERESAHDTDIEEAMLDILKRKHLRVVVVFAEKASAHRLLRYAKANKQASELVWISSDSWRRLDDSGANPVKNAVAVQPLARELRGFDEYIESLRPSNHSQVNPWFNATWEELFKCNASTCDPNPEKGLTHLVNYRQQNYLHFIRDAVYAVAHALHKLHQELCEGKPGICPEMTHLNEEGFLNALKNITFMDEGGQPFRFMDGRDGPPRYSILSYAYEGPTNHMWKVVGNFSLTSEGGPQLHLDESAVPFLALGDKHSCSPQCGEHQILVKDSNDVCCWTCSRCSRYQIQLGPSLCQDCDMGTMPDPLLSKCVPIPLSVLDPYSASSLTAMVIASFGLIMTAFVGCVFFRFGHTPVIKASGRELSWLLLAGIAASFLLTFLAAFAHPAPFPCGAFRFLLGFCHTLCYAAILAKTSRVARIFGQKANHKARFTSPEAQLVLVAAMTSVEAVILFIWLLLAPPTAVHVHPNKGSRLLVCAGLDSDHAYLVALAYPLTLVAASTVYAIKTRKAPGGFNEARAVAFTNYTTALLWLAFVPLYVVSSSHSVRALTLSISLSLSALVQLACLFAPKVYTVLWRPQKNTKEGVMTHHRSSSLAPTPSPAPLHAPSAPSEGSVELRLGADQSKQKWRCSTKEMVLSPSSLQVNKF
ncbi:metabotropic glutamate receptor 2-like [Neocloeon triangulifer]|uniref:metabotropic glutamate receptor 2-like n=1 Tax=Neocloeon triangulifer TaxID=2078957 RepID=UPI00286EBE77|nr:metabotropic glutamate receptor 2-like [Neocloeon triangulifer]